MKEKFDCYLEEKNIVQNYSSTYFYMTFNTNPIRYGVALNVDDIDKGEEIIQEIKEEHREQIQAWNEEQHQRNLLKKRQISNITS